ncbi:MAG: penicillin-binding protein 2 [Gammaproteobacteria bacterium]|nr:penicillin-binding protein 2 [Gammaproteobacteria bacterium]
MRPLSQLKNHWQEQQLTGSRIAICAAIAIILTMIVIAQLVNLQLVRYEYYSAQSQGNRIRVKALPPTRGLIYDRNGDVLAENLPAWHIDLTPEQVPDIEDTLNRLVQEKLIRADKLDATRELIKSRRRFETIAIRQRLSEEDVARFAVLRPYFPGVEVRAGLARNYPNGSIASHALGYMGAISIDDKDRLDAATYAGTSYIGKTAVERSYEADLHGTPGRSEELVNVHGRIIRPLNSELSLPGKDIILTLDLPSQLAAEQALNGRRGSVVAVDPNTGEVLVFASAPAFNPNQFTGGISTKNYKALRDDLDQPLFNRALRGRYPPGSTIKPIIGLAGLDQKAATAGRKILCRGYYSLPGKTHRYRDWKPEGHGMVDLHDAIAQSCDTYFYELAVELDIDNIAPMLKQFGLGEPTGIDIGGEAAGLIPSREWKRANFRDQQDQVWFPGETVITGIGQGYLLTTPLQLAEATAALATRGKRFQPILVKAIKDSLSGEISEQPHIEKAAISGISQRDWNEIIEAMRGVITDPKGTARSIGYQAPYTLAGKSGTAQVFTLAQDTEYDAEEVTERMRDHALFVAFAPIEEPQIAIAVVVENGGSGSGVAAPIARAVMDAYLIPRELAGMEASAQ